MASPSTTISSPRFYRLSLRSRSNVLFVFLSFLLMVAFNLLFSHAALTRALISSALLVVVYSAILWSNSWLGITPTGLSCRVFSGRTLTARWQDVESIGPVPARWVQGLNGEGLLLRAGTATLSPRESPAERWIPLERFAPNWRTSPLGDDIRRYAPWLMEGR